jgi:hypothetical protein
LFKTYLLGFIIGIAGAGALVYSVPVIDIHREASLVSVRPNGGHTETFHINLPQDRIMAVAQDGEKKSAYPIALQWPDEEVLDGAEVEVFKVRNTDGIVVGTASRMSNKKDDSGSFIQWMMHLPARGTLFARMNLGTSESGVRDGLLIVGTREFETLNGSVREFYNAEAVDEDLDITGRLELVTALVGVLGDAE